MHSKFRLTHYFGPGTLVTAAFIGPGTVTVCSLAGAQNGYVLLWALLFSVIATITLQEMSARLGIVTRKGFGETIRTELKQPLLKWVGIALVFSAIVIGNAAYESGNISGAVLGTETIFKELTVTIGTTSWSMLPILIGLIAGMLLYSGNFKWIRRFLTGMVLLMSVVFLTTAIVVMDDIPALLQGLFIPSMHSDQLLMVIALIGTTVVPYNLFLHASVVQQTYKHTEDLPKMRKENAVAILLGGIISMSIVVTSAALQGNEDIINAADMAVQLRPVLGDWAVYFLSTGLFAAGISSAITAPLAAAYAVKGIFGWEGDLKSIRFKLVWMLILLIGVFFSMTSWSPVVIIQFAQVTNGILLPLVGGFLVYIVNQRSVMGEFTNKRWQNLLSIGIIAITVLLSVRSLNAVFNFLNA
ncbi:MAG TPA: manganese transporter [Balneolaceae bacterium]|nr:manganese transporter [Balneolaceae bacterium]|tara:strand:+ start:57254 stop:58495 length:1242 start_codon:yes stop_codon:yes gene_type:complete